MMSQRAGLLSKSSKALISRCSFATNQFLLVNKTWNRGSGQTILCELAPLQLHSPMSHTKKHQSNIARFLCLVVTINNSRATVAYNGWSHRTPLPCCWTLSRYVNGWWLRYNWDFSKEVKRARWMSVRLLWRLWIWSTWGSSMVWVQSGSRRFDWTSNPLQLGNEYYKKAVEWAFGDINVYVLYFHSVFSLPSLR